MIRPISPLDAEQICTIYNHYVENTVVTFEEEHVSDSEMAQRIKNVTSSLPWFVWENEGAIYGYAYATPWRTRSAYRFSVETIVYLAPDRTGLGLGSELYRVLIAELRSHRLHCAIGGAGRVEPRSFLRDSTSLLKVERETGIEPATNGLGSRDSTTELLPLASGTDAYSSTG